MTGSLDHVGRVADRRTGGDATEPIERWIGQAQTAYLDAYRAALADAGRTELLDERLLEPLTAERICRELVYAARVLPRWLYAPMGSLQRLGKA
jgi:maltokinase